MEQNKKPLLVLGAGDFAAEVADIVSESDGFYVVGFVESLNPQQCSRLIANLPVYWIDDIAGFAKGHYAIWGIGTTFKSKFASQIAAHNIPFATIVHPSARVSPTSSLAEGTLVSAGAVIAAYTHIGRHVVVNRGALIGHHIEIADYVTIGPGVNIAGNCRIGEGCYAGMGAIILNGISVGKHSIIGAGSVVTHNVPDNVQVIGVPARIIKKNTQGK